MACHALEIIGTLMQEAGIDAASGIAVEIIELDIKPRAAMADMAISLR